MLGRLSTRLFSSTKKLIITATGKDRVGLVRDVSEMIYSHKGRILNSQHMRLWGSFSEMILAEFPIEQISAVRESAATSQETLGVKIIVNEAQKPSENVVPSENYYVRLVMDAADDVGLLYRLSNYLSSLGVSVDLLSTELTPAPMGGTSLFKIKARLDVPGIVELNTLNSKLQKFFDQHDLSGQISKEE